MQGSILELWDPDRSQTPVRNGNPVAWEAFLTEVALIRQECHRDGSGLHILSGRLRSPTLAVQRAALLAAFPGAAWHQYEVIDDDAEREGALLAFGRVIRPRYRLAQADVVLALESDFLTDSPGHLRYARDFVGRRQAANSKRAMNRLYVVEATPSLTGAKADHRWPLASGRIAAFALELAAALDIPGARSTRPSGIDAAKVRILANDLRSHGSSSLVIAGRSQPPVVHAVAHLLNQALGNVGQTVEYAGLPEASVNAGESIRRLTGAMAAGQVRTLVVLDGNPAYAAPADLSFGEHLSKVSRTVHLGLYRDETAHLCTWHLPRAHALEAWSDLRAFDGSAGIVQPVILPLYDGRSMHELLALIMGEPEPKGADIVRATWQLQGAENRHTWQRWLQAGVITDSGEVAQKTVASDSFLSGRPALAGGIDQPEAEPLELLFRPDSTIWDGRYANNAWLQELPKAVSQLTWSNAALISPELAARHQLHNGDIVTLSMDDRTVEAPVWVVPGQARRSITLPLGYGRSRAGHVGNHLGFDAFGLRKSRTPWQAWGVELVPVGRHRELATTQRHHSMAGRAPVRVATWDAVTNDPGLAFPPDPQPPSLYPDRPAGDYAWGMRSISTRAWVVVPAR